MCVPGCLEAMARGSRRGLPAPPDRGVAAPPERRRSFTRVVHLTHTMRPDFPSFDPGPGLVTETVATLARAGYTMRRLCLARSRRPRHRGRGLVLRERSPR